MNTDTDELALHFAKWLQRYVPPQHLRNNSEARQDEADALLRVILKAAPQTDVMPWLSKALEIMDCRMKTRAWPTVSELSECCSLLREYRSANSANEFCLDPAVVAAKRMARWEPVAEWWLSPQSAEQLIERGLVDEKTIQIYRQGICRDRGLSPTT